MKTPQEWLKEIKHASDTEIRHGSSVFLLESDIQRILIDGWRRGMESALEICEAYYRASNAEQDIEDALAKSDSELTNSILP